MTSYSANQSAKRDHEMIEHQCGVGQGRSNDKVFTCLNQRVEMAKSCEYKIVYLSLFWLRGFYDPCINCLSEFMRFGAVSNKCWILLPVNGYLSVGIRTLLLNCLLHLISFMTSSVIGDQPLCMPCIKYHLLCP